MTDVNDTLRIRPAGLGAINARMPDHRLGQILAGRPPLGGGLEVALACDVILAAVHATLALAGSALGLTLGALLVARSHGRMTPGRILVAVSVVATVAVALLAAPLGPWSVFGCLLLSSLTVPALRTLIDSAMLRLCGDQRRWRTLAAAARTVLRAGPPLGTLAAGLLLQFATGTFAGVLALAAIQACITLYGLGNRISRPSAGGE